MRLHVLAVCRELGISDDAVSEGLRTVSIPGRQEIFSAGQGKMIMVDYAHNGMALSRLLSSLREYNPARLTCIFGCGGQRSRAAHQNGAGGGRVCGFYGDYFR